MSTIIRELTDIQGIEVSAPTENPFTASGLEVFASDAAYEVVRPTPGAGEFYFNSTYGAVRIYNGTAWQFDKTTFTAQTDAATTGANVDLAPNTTDQIIRFTHGSLTSIRSISPSNQRVVHLYNGQASNGITLVNEAAAATAANRILTGSNADIVIQTNQLVSLIYDEDASRWRIMSRSVTGLEAFANDAAYETAHGPAVAGSRYWNTTKLAVHEYDGTGWHTAKVFFEAADESALTGADADLVPTRKQIIKLTNASLTSIRAINHDTQHFLILINATGATISIRNQSTGGTASQRIITGTGVDLSVENDASIIMAYDSQTNRWRVTGGSGSGGTSTSPTNCCLSPNDVATQWSTALGYGWYSSAATAASTTTTAAELPLSPVLNTAIKITRTTVGSYDAYRWRMPTALKNNTLPISWLQIAQTGMSSGEFKLDVYTYTDSAYTTGATRKNLRSDSSSVTSIPAYSGFFGSNNAYSFDTGTEDYYEMRVTRVSGTSWLSIVGIKIGFGDIGVVGAQGEYETASSYTITGTTSNPTPGTGTLYYRNTYRVGRWAIIRYEFRQTVAGTAGSGDYLLPLPTGLSIDYTRAQNVAATNVVGDVGGGYFIVNGAPWQISAQILSTGAYANKILLSLFNETTSGSGWGSASASLANANVQFACTVRIPIQGWDDAIVVGPANTVEYVSDDGTSDVFSPNGSLVPNVAASTGTTTRDFTFSTPQNTNQLMTLELNNAGNGWAPASDFYPFTAGNNNNANNFYGIRGYWSSSTNFRVEFGNQGTRVNTSLADAGAAAWSARNAAGDRFRVGKLNAAIPAGIEHGQLHGGAQLYKAGSNPGLTTGATIAAGYIGEKLESVSGAVNLSGTSAYTDVASIALTAGVWMIHAVCNAALNTGTGMTVFYAAIGTVAGNTGGGAVQGSTQLDGPPPTAQYNTTISIPGVCVNINATTTYYLKGLGIYSGGQPTARGRITAVRIA